MRRAVAGALGLALLGCGASTAPAATTTSAVTTSTTVAPATTIDPGLLPQTAERPTTDDPGLQAATRALWKAIVDDEPAEGMSVFFPRSAYLQVKALPDPAADWQNRLVAAFDRNIRALHAQLGGDPATVRFLSLDVPDRDAVWVRPGGEFNKIGYWRVYGSRLRYTIGGVERSFPVFSLISWRGRWYVVHLHSATG